MDDKLASQITYVQTHPYVVSVELQASEIFRDVIYLSDDCQTQGTPLSICNGMSKSLIAIAKLLRLRRIQFLGLTGIGLDDIDGSMLAAALEEATHSISLEQERLDLTQIGFVPEIRARHLAAGEKASVCMLSSKSNPTRPGALPGPGPCTCPEGQATE